jgi:hypothetical protein
MPNPKRRHSGPGATSVARALAQPGTSICTGSANSPRGVSALRPLQGSRVVEPPSPARVMIVHRVTLSEADGLPRLTRRMGSRRDHHGTGASLPGS